MVPSLGTPQRPVRVAIVGAGPSGFFTADALLRRESPLFEVHVLERLPTPFGLVRTGVAPDHQKIKTVTRTFDRVAQHGRFRFLGNVTVGHDVTADELAQHYDLVVYAIGSNSDRRLGIPGEELTGSHAATAVVGWYNAHPDFRDFVLDPSARSAVVVGVGNVALDVARILLRDRDELGRTDVAGHALDALRASQIREVVLLARRGPAQVAFTLPELQELAELVGVAVRIDPAQVEMDDAQRAALDGQTRRIVERMQSLAAAPPPEAERTLRFEFFASPVEVLDDGDGRVRAVRVERNELVRQDARVEARGTGRFFEVQAGLVFRAIGYFGAPIPGVPFDADRGIIPNVDGRVIQAPGGPIVPGCYAVGWIRRSPLGTIGTNKADANAVSQRIVEDVPKLPVRPLRPTAALDELLQQRGVRVAAFTDWGKLDALEVAAGLDRGKVREKFSTVAEMMNHLLRSAPPRT